MSQVGDDFVYCSRQEALRRFKLRICTILIEECTLWTMNRVLMVPYWLLQ